MGVPKGVKYAIIALGVAAAVGGTWYWLSANKSPVPDSWTLVDVTTGRIESIGKNKLTSVPMANDKGEFTMVRVHKDEAGEYVVSDRDREAVRNLFAGRKDLKVDLNTFRVLK